LLLLLLLLLPVVGVVFLLLLLRAWKRYADLPASAILRIWGIAKSQ
jgi:hypothetical protein